MLILHLFQGWTLIFLCVGILWLISYSAAFPLEDYYETPQMKRERRIRMDRLMGWKIYKSDRFVITGNIGIRIVITDTHEDSSYEIEYGELVKFRRHWDKIKEVNRDTFILTLIAFKIGKTNKSKVA